MVLSALIVEDDPAIRQLIVHILERNGFTTDQAAGGRAAIEMVESGSYDLLVVDLMMPGVDGFAVIDYVSTHCSSTLRRIIVLTAMNQSVVEKSLPDAVCRVLSKPFDVEQFITYAKECSKAA